MQERIIDYINKHEGVEWVTMAQICDEFQRKGKRASDDGPPTGAAK